MKKGFIRRLEKKSRRMVNEWGHGTPFWGKFLGFPKKGKGPPLKSPAIGKTSQGGPNSSKALKLAGEIFTGGGFPGHLGNSHYSPSMGPKKSPEHQVSGGHTTLLGGNFPPPLIAGGVPPKSQPPGGFSPKKSVFHPFVYYRFYTRPSWGEIPPPPK